MSYELVVKIAETEEEREGAVAVRMRVFVEEQQIPAEEELDDADATAIHAVAVNNGKIVGTGRLIDLADGTGQIGRMAVDQEYRRRGTGGQILLFLEEQGRARGMIGFILHAQEYVKSFYARHGYVEHGDVFLEVDIPHVEMRKGVR